MFKRVKGVHLSSISSLATFALLLDLAGINTEFSGAITTQFCFTYTLEGVTAMPRGLHARLCHAFLVCYATISSWWKIKTFNTHAELRNKTYTTLHGKNNTRTIWLYCVESLNTHNTVFGSKGAAICVHKLFTFCNRRGLLSRDSIVDCDWLPDTEWCCVISSVVNPRRTSQKIWDCTGQGNDFELIPTVEIKTINPVECYYFW